MSIRPAAGHTGHRRLGWARGGYETKADAASETPEDAMQHEVEQSDDFHIETERVSDDTALVALQGQVDLHTAPELRDQLVAAIENGAINLVVDLTETTFIDSMTLGVLLGAVKRLRPRGGRLRIVCDDSNIRKIFEITLLDRVFALYGTRAQALERLVSASG
jgi:anti-sigma B factor antagonist